MKGIRMKDRYWKRLKTRTVRDALRFKNLLQFALPNLPEGDHEQKDRASLQSQFNAFTLGEVLLALMVCVLCASLMSMQTGVLKRALELREDSQEQFAIVQIREMSAIARTVNVQAEKLILETPEKTERIEFDQHRLVKKSGYMILMEQIDGASFYTDNGSIYLEVQYGSKRHIWQIR